MLLTFETLITKVLLLYSAGIPPLYGDSLKSCAVAIIVPDEDAVSVWAKENNITGNFIKLCTNDVRMMPSFRVACILWYGADLNH